MELLNSRRRGNQLFQNRTIYSFYHHKSHGKVKDKKHLKGKENGKTIMRASISYTLYY